MDYFYINVVLDKNTKDLKDIKNLCHQLKKNKTSFISTSCFLT